MPEPASTIQTRLREGNIRFLRVVWCDNGNVIRGKAIHIDALTRQLEGGTAGGVGCRRRSRRFRWWRTRWPPAAAGAGGGGVAGARLGDVADAPLCPRAGQGNGRHGDRWPALALVCTQFLRRMVQRAADQGFTIKAAFEPEFYLLRREARSLSPPIRRPLRPPWRWIVIKRW
jgi:glutamine synthetase